MAMSRLESAWSGEGNTDLSPTFPSDQKATQKKTSPLELKPFVVRRSVGRPVGRGSHIAQNE